MASRRGGYSAAEWDAAKQEARAVLVSVAAAGSFITYGDLVQRLHVIPFEPRSPLLNNMLGEISQEEDARGYGMLSVVVVHRAGDQMPGDGFFTLARRLGRPLHDREQLWVSEVAKVHASYRQFAPPPTRPAPPAGSRFKDETELHRLGYNVTDLNDAGRWDVLVRVAIPELGLRTVVETIAGLVRVRKLQRLGSYNYQNAIDRWESDLRRLKIEYFQDEFIWPSTDPT